MEYDDIVSIRFIGIGCHIVKCELEETLLTKIYACAKTLKLTMKQIFFDSEFYSLLNMPAYASWQHFNNLQDISGLLESHRSQVEIRLNKKPRKKIRFNELTNEGLLFPLYNVEKINIDINTEHRSVTIIEEDIGTTAFYKFNCPKFDVDNLRFQISTVKAKNDMAYSILSGIFYSGIGLKPYKSDTLVISIHSVID
jgi:hypothetical protein